jgi:Protein of unknown function (DUF935)
MKKSHSSGNGHQQSELLRHLRASRDETRSPKSASQERPSLQSRIDRAVALGDREVGIGGPKFGVGDKSSYYRSPLSPTIPVPRPEPNSESRVPNPATVGVPGTPVVGGFLLDLGEYNPELMGRNALPTYEKMRRGDAQVRATLAACKLPVQSAKWDVVPAEDVRGSSNVDRRATNNVLRTTSSIGAGKNTAAKAKEVAQFVKDNLFGGLEFRTSTGALISQSWDEVVRNALLMLDFGCAVHEDVWTVDGNRIRLRRLAPRHPLTFYQWMVDEDGETLLTLIQYGYRRAQYLQVSLPVEKMCRFTYQQEAANFWGIALLRSMYPHWYAKNSLYRIDAIACERNALGIPVFKLPVGFSKEDKEAAFNFVSQLATHESTGMVEPPGDPSTGFRVVGCEGRVREVMPSIQHHNTMISRAALAMFLELGVEAHGGSRALGQSHTDFFFLALQSLADQVALTLRNTSVRRLVEYNFGDSAPMPKLVAANVQARGLQDIAQALNQFALSGLVVSEDNLRKFIREELALPEESDRGIVAIRGEAVMPEGQADKGEVAGKSADWQADQPPQRQNDNG